MLPTCTKLGQDKITKKSWNGKVLEVKRFLHIIHFYSLLLSAESQGKFVFHPWFSKGQQEKYRKDLNL